MLTPAQQAAIPIMAAAAVASEIATRDNGNPGLPAIVTYAQCEIECGWLQHAPGNNAFGIKLYSGAYGKQLLGSTEWFTPDEANRWIAGLDGRTAFSKLPLETNALYKPAFAAYCAQQAAHPENATANTESFLRQIAPVYARNNATYADVVIGIMRGSQAQSAIQNARVQAAS